VLLDAFQQVVPVGIPGEMYIAGAGLAREYINRSELTQEKFVENPYHDGTRLYRSGDLARYLPNGELEYLGRIDHQVKVRGYRIELGEIESCLNNHHAITSCHVMVREESRDKRIVAYIISSHDEIDLSELRDFLKDHLLTYMIPSAFVELSEFPLTANGKLDAQALPAPSYSAQSHQHLFEAPSNPIENILLEIWQTILELEQLGIHDNFFELGGHSLLATKVISNIRDKLRLELPLRALFENPTIAGIATHLERLVEINSTELLQLEPIKPVARDQKLPLSFAQERLWFLESFEPNQSAYNIPASIRLKGDLDVAALKYALQQMVNRHESLRTLFESQNGVPSQNILPSMIFDLSVVDIIGEDNQKKMNHLVQECARLPFNLTEGPLIRALLMVIDDNEHVLVVTMHHIISDGWSMGIFVDELVGFYQQGSQRSRQFMDELPIQYVDYAVWQRNWLDGDVLDEQINYWKKQLKGIERLEMPTDRHRPALKTYRGASLSFNLPRSVSQALESIAHINDSTLYMILLAAFQILLSRYTGQKDICIGSPVAGRHRRELESLIGFFVNTVVMRSQINPQQKFTHFLQDVRKTTLDAFTHQQIPFEKLVENSQPERDPSTTPLFQVMFALQNTPMNKIDLEGLEITPVENQNSIAKFDLTLVCQEVEQGLRGSLEYNTDLFDTETIERLLGHYRHLLKAIVTDAELKIADYSILSQQEVSVITQQWNETHCEYPDNQCVHDIFAKVSSTHTSSIALEFADTKLSYADLHQQSNQLAHFLLKQGVKTGSMVMVCMDRSIDLVKSLLAILKLGCVYVPLNPAYPTARLKLMIEDCATSFIITQSEFVSHLPEINKLSIISLDEQSLSDESVDDLNIVTKSTQAAYVIYTSGSTGRPKGTVVPHKAIVRLVINSNFMDFNAKDRVAHASNISFDAATVEL
ncbi:MAG: AMP-binding protein, partial [Methylococcales bacterium]|nr:AMP-binding protein [Methylococcales bacterium]